MGRSKSDLPFGPETLLQRVVRLTSAVATPVVIAAAHDQVLPPFLENPLVVRDPPDPTGPLHGIETALARINDDVEFVYVGSVDAPFFSSAWLAALLGWIGELDAAIPVSNAGGTNPLSALYRTDPLRRAVDDLRRRGERRAVELARSLTARMITEPEVTSSFPEGKPLWNVNTPDEYQKAIWVEFEG